MTVTNIKVMSHDDLDGVGCGMLAKLAFGDDVSVSYCSYGNIEKRMKNFLSKKENEQRELYITDISVKDPQSIAKLEKRYQQGVPLYFIDHHQTALSFNQYAWSAVKVTYEDGRKTSATSLYYEHLLEKGLLERTSFLDTFVELVRLYDTWEWEKEENLEAKRLNDLFYMIGLTQFEETFLHRAKTADSFFFDDTQKTILELEEKKIERYINQKENQMLYAWLDNYKAGVVYAENYHSELGNILNKRHPHLDFIVILNMGGKKISLRTIHEQVNVSKIASRFGGGGHPKASGCPMNDQTLSYFVTDLFSQTPTKRDADANQYNLKETAFETLYKGKDEEYVSIIPLDNGRWDVWKNKISFGHFASFQEAEKYVKRAFTAYVVFDEEYVTYLSEKHNVSKQKLKSQFERTMNEYTKKALV